MMEINNLKWLKKKIQEMYGSKCKDYEEGCIVCNAWSIYDDIKEDEEGVDE